MQLYSWISFVMICLLFTNDGVFREKTSVSATPVPAALVREIRAALRMVDNQTTTDAPEGCEFTWSDGKTAGIIVGYVVAGGLCVLGIVFCILCLCCQTACTCFTTCIGLIVCCCCTVKCCMVALVVIALGSGLAFVAFVTGMMWYCG